MDTGQIQFYALLVLGVLVGLYALYTAYNLSNFLGDYLRDR